MLAEKMRSLREKAGLTQQDLATAAALSISMISQIEQGRKPDLRISTLIHLAEALGIEPGELFAVFVEQGVAPRKKRGAGVAPPEKAERTGRPRGRPAKQKDEAGGKEINKRRDGR